MKIKLLILAMYILLCASLWCASLVTNLTASQRKDATQKVDIYFNVSKNVPMTISLLASNDNGTTWNLTCAATLAMLVRILIPEMANISSGMYW